MQFGKEVLIMLFLSLSNILGHEINEDCYLLLQAEQIKKYQEREHDFYRFGPVEKGIKIWNRRGWITANKIIQRNLFLQKDDIIIDIDGCDSVKAFNSEKWWLKEDQIHKLFFILLMPDTSFDGISTVRVLRRGKIITVKFNKK